VRRRCRTPRTAAHWQPQRGKVGAQPLARRLAQPGQAVDQHGNRGEPNKGSSRLLVQVACGSGSLQNTCSQQVELRPPLHLPLDQLEPGDLSFGLSIAPRQRQRGLHRGFVLIQTSGEGCQLTFGGLILRWSPWLRQFGGWAKLGSGYRQAANFSVPVAQ